MNATKMLEELREVDLFNPDSAYYCSHRRYIEQLENLVHQQADRIAELEHAFASTYAEYKQYYEQTKHLEAQVYGGTTK